MTLRRWVGLMALIIVASTLPYVLVVAAGWILYRRVHGRQGC